MNIRNASGIPPANSFKEPIKAGILQKKTKRRIFKAGSWQRKFCVLNDIKLYIYENEESNGQEKRCSLINLRYYDSCYVDESKDKKDAENAFIIQQSEKLGFFDVKHIFCTESKEERNEWISKIKGVISEISKSSKNQRNERSKDSGKRRSITFDKLIPQADKLKPVTKDRAKGPKGRRLPNRKSEYPEKSGAVEDRVEKRTASEIMSSNSMADNQDDTQNIQFMDGGAEEKQDLSSTENSLTSQEAKPELEKVSNNNNIPIEDVNNASDNRESDAAQTLMKELEQKWGTQTKDEQKEKTKNTENEVVATSTRDSIQLRQLSVTSNISANSDRTSTYQFYMLEKDIKSLKRDVNSIQILKNTSKTVQTTVDSLQNTVAELKNDVKDIKTAINALAEKMQNLKEIVKSEEEDDEPETDEDTLI
ncbi:hypothetical protein GQR58_016306 [Nymphon striatum]|nr:hypothetical protein GQR58_016306 [Nymphon striatum]